MPVLKHMLSDLFYMTIRHDNYVIIFVSKGTVKIINLKKCSDRRPLAFSEHLKSENTRDYLLFLGIP